MTTSETSGDDILTARCPRMAGTVSSGQHNDRGNDTRKGDGVREEEEKEEEKSDRLSRSEVRAQREA